MKRYVPIVIGVVALCAVLYVGNNQMKDDDLSVQEQDTALLTSFTGTVTRVFEGDNVLEYGLDLPENATTSIDMDGALVKISEGDTSLAQVYFSFEGGRGYSPEDYITNKIVTKVAAVTPKENVTIGSHDWSVVESEWSVWHVARSSNGKWLIVVENKKADNDKAGALIESIITK